MIEPGHSGMPLLRERRAELQRKVPDFDRCFASNEIWLRRLRHLPDFDRLIAEGEIALASYIERRATNDTEATGPMPDDSEPRR